LFYSFQSSVFAVSLIMLV